MNYNDKLIEDIELTIYNIQQNDKDIIQIISQPSDIIYKIDDTKKFNEAKFVIENYIKDNINSQSKIIESIKIKIEEINLEYIYLVDWQMILEKRNLELAQIINPEILSTENTLLYHSNNPWDYPDIEMKLGKKYYKLILSEKKLECTTCKGSGLCKICNGKKEVECDKCTGQGFINCTDSNCYNGDCGTCAGKGHYICSNCGGNGVTRDGRRCTNCSGGIFECKKCKRTGKCQICRGKAKVLCSKCQGKKKQNCKECINNSGSCTNCKGKGTNEFIKVLNYEFTKVDVNENIKDNYSNQKFYASSIQEYKSSLDFYNSSKRKFLMLSSKNIIEAEKLDEHLPKNFIEWLKNKINHLLDNEKLNNSKLIGTVMQIYILPKYTVKYKINDDSFIFNSFNENFSSGIVFKTSIIETLKEETRRRILNNISNNKYELAISEAEDYLNTIQNDLAIKNLLIEAKTKPELILFEELFNKNKAVDIIKRYSRIDKSISQNEKIMLYYQKCKNNIAQIKSSSNFLLMFIPAIVIYFAGIDYEKINGNMDGIIILIYYATTIALFRILVHLYYNKVNQSIISFIIIAIICLIIAICVFIIMSLIRQTIF